MHFLTGLLVSCVNDMNAQLKNFIPAKETETGSSTDNKVLLVGVMEPTIEYIVKCIFKDVSKVCCVFEYQMRRLVSLYVVTFYPEIFLKQTQNQFDLIWLEKN